MKNLKFIFTMASGMSVWFKLYPCLLHLLLYQCLAVEWIVCSWISLLDGHVTSLVGFHWIWWEAECIVVCQTGHWNCGVVSCAFSYHSVLFVMEKSMDYLIMYLLWDDEGPRGMCVLSVPFSDTRCVSNLSKHSIAGDDGPEMGLEWVLDGLEKGLQIWMDGLV